MSKLPTSDLRPLAPVVILVRPQMGENIGAVARAMNNFGLSELRIAAPRDGWPNPKALEMAANAESIIENAKIFPNFQAALEGVNLAYATTARGRDLNKQVMLPEQAMQEIVPSPHKIALVFGPERTGLENEEISLCDRIISIPTDSKNPSLNIAQSTVIIGYEWLKASAVSPPTRETLEAPATKEEIFSMFEQLEKYLDETEYFRTADKKPAMWLNLKNMFLRGQWSSQEMRTFRGMLRSLTERSK